jgi:hypothetical protein
MQKQLKHISFSSPQGETLPSGQGWKVETIAITFECDYRINNEINFAGII